MNISKKIPSLTFPAHLDFTKSIFVWKRMFWKLIKSSLKEYPYVFVQNKKKRKKITFLDSSCIESYGYGFCLKFLTFWMCTWFLKIYSMQLKCITDFFTIYLFFIHISMLESVSNCACVLWYLHVNPTINSLTLGLFSAFPKLKLMTQNLMLPDTYLVDCSQV